MTTKYANLAAVKKEAEIPAAQRKLLHGRSCDQVYTTYNAIFEKACKSAMNPEEQFILYLRCGELYTMIRQKNGFATFVNKNTLHSTFKSAMSQMETLESILKEKYEKSQPAVVAAPAPVVAPEVPQVEIPAPVPVLRGFIKPRELLRIVEMEKKTAIILDFRSNQQTERIKYTKGDSHQVTVVSIPRETITNGLIFSSLKNLINVGQRALLSRVAATDYVVLMDDESPRIVEGEAEKGSHAHALKLAISDYNLQEKPRNAPLFMEGGMGLWKLQYPMYMQREEGNNAMAVGDSLSQLIANYKRPSLEVQYHDFSPKKAPRPPLVEREEVTNVPEEIMLIEEGKKPDVPSPPTGSPTPNENSPFAPSSLAQPELPNGLPTLPCLPPRPKTPPRLAGGESAAKVFPAQEPNDITGLRDLKIIQPNVDRSNKPAEVVVRNIVLPHQAPTPAPRTAMPTVDRSAKPGLISGNDQKMLMQIYRGMTDNIWNNSSKRSTPRPGQTGLNNMGNTCFMNACLQALFQTPEIVNIFTQENFISRVNTQNALGTKGVISAVFSALIDNVWSGQFEYFRPQKFLELFATEVNSMLMNGQQQDASEFYMILLASLHEDTNQVASLSLSLSLFKEVFKVWKGVPPVQNYTGGLNIRKEALDFDRKQNQFSYSPVSRALYPRTVSEVTCAQCRTQSITFEDVNIIQVGLPPESHGRAALTDCLNLSFSVHNLDGRWECPRCKTARPATQKLSLWNPPSVVVVHLLRFSFVNGDYVKNDIPVAFDTEHLDLAPYLHDSAERGRDSVYKLYSVTNHRGRLNSGHYTAFSRHLQTNEWMRCDDERVSGARASDIDFSAAYILYFKKRGL